MSKHLPGVALLLIVVPSVSLSGCSQTPSDRLEDYLVRISRVLAVDQTNKPILSISRYSVKNNELIQQQQTISLLEFLRINHCQLGQTVGYRNSPLGKIAVPSQKMHIERDILLHAQSCIDRLQNQEPELAHKLDKIIAVKQQQRMHTWWNAWLTGNEWQKFIAVAADAIEIAGPQPAHLSLSLQALDYALSQGRNWLEKRYEYQSSEMENHLQQLLLGESLGRWRRSLSLSTQTLDHAAQMLEQRLDNKSLCWRGSLTPEAKILHNVFLKFYVGVVQPYLSRTHQFGDQLLDRLQEMAELAPAPPSYLEWLSELEQQQQEFNKVNMRHVRAWQNTLEECGLMPSSS